MKIGLDGNSNGLESTNADNPSTFSTNNTFLIWGHDGEALTDRDENIDFDPLQVKSRLNREWKVQETGIIGSVVVQFDISTIEGLAGPGTSDESQVVLLIDNDSDFSSGASLVLQSFVTPGDGLVNFNVDFSSGQYFTLASSEENALAVSLISFEARHQNNAIHLTWSTGSEEANSLFRIERSADGEQFETIGYVEGAHNSSGLQEYEFSDNNPIIGTSYYRLIDIDLTGKENASEMIRVIFHPSTEISPPYPNPIRQGDYIKVPIHGRTSHTLTVFNASGVPQPISWFERGGLLYVSTAALRAGQYMLRVKTPQYARTHKVFVLNN
ncbi:MAG: T9SS type A sorting domain-containing protein [Roseivirga sp.]|nr:T9SS type A sorting domain-containing protein [Roseivirga sp.]